MSTLFVSDLHLDAALPAAIAQFEDFARDQARESEALYILGDLFESWVGDDDDDPGRARRPAREGLELPDRGGQGRIEVQIGYEKRAHTVPL
jgi:UDP-2,3-diacylglucosamine pyrophosphatase LpxH